jgi:Rap1 GTPase-GDP dissociation stimulator 1
MFGPDVLPHLVTPIRAYIPLFQTPPPPFNRSTPLRRTLVAADLKAFEESCSLLEALVLDDDVQLLLKSRS